MSFYSTTVILIILVKHLTGISIMHGSIGNLLQSLNHAFGYVGEYYLVPRTTSLLYNVQLAFLNDHNIGRCNGVIRGTF